MHGTIVGKLGRCWSLCRGEVVAPIDAVFGGGVFSICSCVFMLRCCHMQSAGMCHNLCICFFWRMFNLMTLRHGFKSCMVTQLLAQLTCDCR